MEPLMDPRGRVEGGLSRLGAPFFPLLLVLVWKRRRNASSAPDSSLLDLPRVSVQQAAQTRREAPSPPPKKRQRRTVQRKTREG